MTPKAVELEFLSDAEVADFKADPTTDGMSDPVKIHAWQAAYRAKQARVVAQSATAEPLPWLAPKVETQVGAQSEPAQVVAQSAEQVGAKSAEKPAEIAGFDLAPATQTSQSKHGTVRAKPIKRKRPEERTLAARNEQKVTLDNSPNEPTVPVVVTETTTTGRTIVVETTTTQPTAAEPALPLVAVMADKFGKGYDGSGSLASAVEYKTPREAFEGSHSTDAHFVQYSCPDFACRINQAALDHMNPGAALQMAFLAVDVDAPGHNPTEAWRQVERAKMKSLYDQNHAPMCAYETKGGYRLVWLLTGSFELESKADAARWRSFYLSGLKYLARVFDIQGDEACADPTRVFRLPRVVRDGVSQELNAGRVNANGTWNPSISAEDLVPVDVIESTAPVSGIQDAPAAIEERARAYVAAIPGACRGDRDRTTYQVACECKRFKLSPEQAEPIVAEYAARCNPPFDEDTPQRKIQQAYADPTAVFGEHLKAEDEIAAVVNDVLAKAKPSGFSECVEHPFDGLTGDDLFADTEPVDLVVPELDVGVGRPTGFVGLGNSKKTLAAMQLALDVSQGRPVWGRFPVNRARKVLYLDYESGPITHEKMRRMAKGAKLKGSDLQGKLEVCIEPKAFLDSPHAGDALEAKIRAGGFELCIVDSLCQCNPFVDENTAKASEPLKYMKHISVKTGCAFVVVHHARKPQPDGKPGDQNMVRGHSSIFNTMGSVLLFRAGEDKNGPSIVKHDRAYNTGRTIADFAIEATDICNGETTEQGLAVTHKDLGDIKDANEAEAEVVKNLRNVQRASKLEEKIIAEVTKAPDRMVPSFNALFALLGGNRNEVQGALDRLVAQGKLSQAAVKRGRASPITLRTQNGEIDLNQMNRLSGAWQ